MAKFGEVFSTTWKVLVALLLISVGIAIIYGIGIAVGSGGGSSSRTTSEDISKEIRQHIKDADEMHTTMPQTKWMKFISVAIKQHCPVNGMTKAELERAVGKPTGTDFEYKNIGYGERWIYEKDVQKECCFWQLGLAHFGGLIWPTPWDVKV